MANNRSIKKPRFFCDIIQYLKAIGKNGGSRVLYEGGSISRVPGDEDKVWNLNPYQQKLFNWSETSETAVKFQYYIDQEETSDGNLIQNEDHQLYKLLSYTTDSSNDNTGWYAGVLNHNIKNLNINQAFYGYTGDGLHYANQQEISEIVNCQASTNNAVPEYNGFSLWKVNNRYNQNEKSAYSVCRFSIEPEEGSFIDRTDIGALTTGIFLTPETAVDMKASINHNYDGINLINTAGGSTLTNAKYLGSPNWGDQPPWTLQKVEGQDYRSVRNFARRSWQLSFAYLSQDSLFDDPTRFNSYTDDQFNEDGSEIDQYTSEQTDVSNFSTFFKLTFNGKLPFIFQPDMEVNEFALCRLTSQPQFRKVADNLYSTSFTVTETW